jgi:predicted SnoaL-like aldol condensation-catalyzing enzyme
MRLARWAAQMLTMAGRLILVMSGWVEVRKEGPQSIRTVLRGVLGENLVSITVHAPSNNPGNRQLACTRGQQLWDKSNSGSG